MDKVYTEYEKHGFFHIGALPVAVLDGVTLMFRDPALAAKNLALLRSWLGGGYRATIWNCARSN